MAKEQHYMKKYSTLVDAVITFTKLIEYGMALPISQLTSCLEKNPIKKHFTAKKAPLILLQGKNQNAYS